MTFLNTINYIPNERITIIDNILRNKQKGMILVCFGNGIVAKLITNFLAQFNIVIDQYCVSDEYICTGGGIGLNGKKLLPFSQLKTIENGMLIIGFQNYKRAMEIKESLDIPCFYIDDPYVFYHMSYEWVLKNLNALEETYAMLSDDFSKKVMTAFVNTRVSGNPKEIFDLRSSDKEDYDFALLKLSDSETILDCGAFTGDSILDMLSYTKNKYKKIYAFEPDEKNILKMKENLKSFDNIEYVCKGAWNKDEVLRFSENNGSASTIVSDNAVGYAKDTGNVTEIAVTAIDKVLDGSPVSFIKMDIEGSELKALEGAKNTIKTHKPKLAICIYHRLEDIITIPQFINSLFSGEECPYNYYIRHHSVSLAETVFYAVPKDVK